MEYDIIGDIHGHSEPLVRLLDDLGYSYSRGAYRHSDPNRMAIFLGDIIDRGPDQLGSIDIVRRMMDAGTGLCTMGNHEHAAIGWLLPDPDMPDQRMRPHTQKNYNQHRVFLEQVGDDVALASELADWMLSLPLYLSLPGIRCVHACWQPDVIAKIEAMTRGAGTFTQEMLYDSFRKGHDTREAIDITIRGSEVELPDGLSFIDSDGAPRDKSRVKWWNDKTPLKLRDLIVDPIDTDVDTSKSHFINLGDPDKRPVFFGHYWMKGEPQLLGRKATCLDFSVAAGGDLCAYSWRGEDVLDPDNLSWVSNRHEVRHGYKLAITAG
jgi:hypothetical protein|nr:metallophosphoesterase [Neorhizobium tomejilense]